MTAPFDASNAFTVYRTINGGTAGVSIKTGRGRIAGWYLANLDTSAVFVKLYDKASAPTSADTPVLTIPIPASGAANLLGALGLYVTLGLGIRVTGGLADNDATAPTASTAIVNLFYQ